MHRALVIAALITATACTTVDYTSQQFPEETADHRTIAILPFEVVFTGPVPERLTVQQIVAIEEAESLAFQTALYNSMLDRAGARRRHPITIEIQPVETTNRLLDRRGVTIRDSWTIPAEGLARKFPYRS